MNFVNFMIKNNIIQYQWNKRLQKYFIKLYKEANKAEINITDLKKKFKEETGKELVLDNYIIGRIK